MHDFATRSRASPSSEASLVFLVSLALISNLGINPSQPLSQNVERFTNLRVILAPTVERSTLHLCSTLLYIATSAAEAKTTIHKASLVCPTQQVCCDWLPCLPVSCLQPSPSILLCRISPLPSFNHSVFTKLTVSFNLQSLKIGKGELKLFVRYIMCQKEKTKCNLC